MVSYRRVLWFIAVLFAVIGSLHLVRAVIRLEMILGGWVIPLWISVLSGVVLLGLSRVMFRMAGRKYSPPGQMH